MTPEDIRAAFTKWRELTEQPESRHGGPMLFHPRDRDLALSLLCPPDVECPECNQSRKNLESMAHYHEPKAPLREVLQALTGAEPPAFVVDGVYFSGQLDEPAQAELHQWAVDNVKPGWLTGIALIEAADQQIQEAIDNANIEGPPEPSQLSNEETSKMAYGNWGAIVKRNGERVRTHEDATPYTEETTEPGYWQAFGRALDERLNPHHAVLGGQRLRLCGYKCYAVLFVDGQERDLAEFRADGSSDEPGERVHDGEIDGYRFHAEESENFIDLELTEPDGTKWEARCGYCYGAGFEDGEDE